MISLGTDASEAWGFEASDSGAGGPGAMDSAAWETATWDSGALDGGGCFLVDLNGADRVSLTLEKRGCWGLAALGRKCKIGFSNDTT